MSLLGYSLMTVLHELLFSFENICNLYNLLLKNYDTYIYIYIYILIEVKIGMYCPLS